MDNNTFKINDNTNTFQNNPSSIFQWVQSISIYTWILVFIILSLLGFNIVIYLEKIKKYVEYSLRYISKLSSQTLGKKQSNKQEKSSRTDSNKVEDPPIVEKVKKISDDHEESKDRTVMKNNALNMALNDNMADNSSTPEVNKTDYQADDSRSFLNNRNEGWCFIGENNGTRVCGEVGLNDECMSGKIFPSSDLCVNPNLRV